MIRPGTVDDIPWMLDLLHELHTMSGTPVPFNVPAAMAEIAQAIASPDMLCLVVENVAVLGAAIATQGGIRIAHERVWITRKAGWGLRLMAAYEAWAKERGCAFIRLNPKMGDTRTERLLDRSGYAPVEVSWCKAL
jgi:GNAT superfamily N-acetyltransferase